MIRLEARQGGVIEALRVPEAEVGHAGRAIATLKLSHALGGGSDKALGQSRDAQAAAVAIRGTVPQATPDAERRQFVARREAMTRELAQTRRGGTLQDDRLKLARAEIQRAETIAWQGFLPRREFELRQALAVEQEEAAGAGAALSYEREIGQVRARLAVISIDLDAAGGDAALARGNLEQQRAQVETQPAVGTERLKPSAPARHPSRRLRLGLPDDDRVKS
ncbi:MULTISPECIES: hypothetical protein [unclassified Brevundimonas]|uniref:hypothetical protein n=1 Tax=unclassified Brevundimonas TaxID=2622653 RepID=UPI003F8F0225